MTRPHRLVWTVGALVFAGLWACETPHSIRPRTALDAAYILRAGKGPRAVSTSVYRDVLSLSLYSRCALVPSDSEYYDRRARRCGVGPSVLGSIARLYLEEARGPAFLPGILYERRFRWVDLPVTRGCGP